MATNVGPFQFDENTSDRGLSVLRTGLGMAPAAFAVYAAAQGFTNTAPGAARPLRSGQALQGLGRALGASARKRGGQEAQRAAAVRDALRRAAEGGAAFERIKNKLDGYNGVIQMLSTALEDPAFGVEATQVRMLKEQLVGSIDSLDQQNTDELLRSVINTLVDSDVDDQALLRLSRYQDEFSGVGKQIQVPDFDIHKSGIPYNPIDVGAIRHGKVNGYTGDALRRGQEILSRFGDNYHIEFHGGSEFGHSQGLVAQIYSKSRKIHLANVPLQTEQTVEGLRLFRTGQQFNTAYAAPRGAVDVRELDRAYAARGVAGVRDAMTSGRARRTFEDQVMSMLEKYSRHGEFRYRDFNAALRGVSPVMTRVGASSHHAFGDLTHHVRAQAGIATNFLSGFNMEGIEQERLQRILGAAASAPGFDPGRASSMLTGFDDQRVAKIGLAGGSVMDHLSNIFGFARKDIPVTARVEQLVGRQDSFYNPVGRAARRAGGSLVGAVGAGQNIMGDLVTGGFNQFMVMDYKGLRGVSGEGYGFTGSSRFVNHAMDMVILDPKSHGLGASKLLNRINSAGSAGLYLTKEELGQYLGQTPAGKVKNFNLPPNALGARVAIDRVVDAAGKRQIHLAVNAQLESDIGKYFSMTFKGNIRNVGAERMRGLFRGGIEHDIERFLGQGNVGDAAFISPDMIKKGEGILAYQISRSAELISGTRTHAERMNLAKTIGNAAGSITDEQIAASFGKGAGTAHKFGVAAFRHLKGKASGKDLGMLLTGLYHRGDSQVQAELTRMIQQEVGTNDRQAALDAMHRGMAMFVETVQRGPTAADEYGAGRPGMEARTAQNIYETLITQGMKKEEASKVVGNIYGDKIGFRKHFELASHMMKLTASITGQEGPFGSTPGQKMTYQDMLEKVAVGEDMSDVLKQVKGGVRLDLSTADSRVRDAVKNVFGQTDIYLPGKEMMDMARGTDIKQGGGAPSLAIDSEYGQLVNSLRGRLGRGGSRKELEGSLREWKSDALKLFSDVHSGLARGKLLGSTTGTAAMYDLTHGAGLKQNEFAALKKLYARTQGQFTGMNTEGFLSVLLDRKTIDPLADTSWKLRTFFTGMEQGANRFKGIHSIGGRDPMMSGQNVFIEQIGRDIHEVSRYGNEDRFFRKFADSEVGKAAISKFEKAEGRTVTGFGDIAKGSKAAQIDLFDSFAKNLSQFTGGQGGAVFSTPVVRANVGGLDLDIGVSTGAFLDRDGDAVKRIMLRRKDSQALSKLSANQSLGMRSIIGELSEAMGPGTKNFGAGLGAAPVGVDAVMEDALKEMGLNQATGRVDVRLRGLHQALLDYGDDPGTTSRARAMLAALQEKGVLKTKKLDRYSPIAAMFANAADRMMVHGDTGAMNDFLRNVMFKGTEFANGATIGGAPYTALDGAANADLIQNLNASRTGFTLDDVMGEFKRVADHAIANQTNYGTTSGAWQSRLKNEATAARAMQDLQAGRDMQSAALREFIGETIESRLSTAGSAFDQIKALGSRVNASTAGIIGVGLATSVALMGAMGDEGYSSTPLMMPGEKVNSRVTDAIARGNLFSSQRRVHQDQMERMVNSPLPGGTAYAPQQNAYQIRGETYTDVGLDQLTAFMHRATGGRVGGSIFVNDARRPITSAYSDRMMGEY